LARQCQAVEISFAALEMDGALLDQFYIPTRYPNGLPFPAVPSESYTEDQARSAERAARCVIEAVESYLKSQIG
jgi:HEPN domain-containing protein